MNLLVPTLEVQLECFEGPMAVLITLIKRNKLSIWDIPIAMITDRFLQYVEIAREMNLKIAEDFIEMASLLLFIKSKLLLPSNGAGEEEDPREELVERIIEYERIRNMAVAINDLPMLERDVYSIGKGGLEKEAEFDLMCLCTLYFELMRVKEETYFVVREVRPTLEEKIGVLKDVLRSEGIFEWDVIVEEDRNERVVTILGMLELAKIRVATLTQRRPFGKIIMKKRELAQFMDN
ncbi:MAG: ScpA family protein [Syntrophorhabdaceae bacterium]|nr:segregation/condensation protein A [Syntrophorhabdaceae bacterium]MDD4196371.1 ScpA family protein [Syntrophorhabdaceae bacterium]HOC45910.1 ScpA family protein [Syntrophorhabdaceae bacterium]